MSFDSEEYKKMLAELKAEYVNSLLTKIADIESCLNEQNAEGLREHFHKLKGNGKTYGVPEISIIGELTENLFLNSKEKGFEATPLAVTLLRAVYEKEAQAKDYDIEQDPQLEKLRAL